MAETIEAARQPDGAGNGYGGDDRVARSRPDPLRDGHDAMVKTYRYLRGGLVGVVVLLAVAIIKEAIDNRCFQTSISAYYYTPARAIFVGVLFILGFGLIVLRGHRSVEDIVLNIAGMLAPIVAIMPTTDVGTCGIIDPNPSPIENGELAGWVVQNVDNNLWALMITGLVGVVATFVVGLIAMRVDQRRGGTVLTRRTGYGLLVVAALIVATMLVYALAPEWSRSHAHGWSAVAMFVALAAVALLNSRPEYTAGRTYQKIYLTIGVLMVGVGAFCFIALGRLDHQILVLEASEILLFAAYWAVQTVEHWDEANPRSDGSNAIDRPVVSEEAVAATARPEPSG
jgi:hypothetical protein